MKFSICNEVFGARQSLEDWKKLCEFLASCGYEGVEVAPFTFGESVREVDAAPIKNIADEAGLQICALHWLLVSPPGLHLHSKDEAKRRRTIDYLKSLADFAAELGAPVMILGSNRQRYLENGDYSGALERTRQTLHEVSAHLQARDVILCPEALPAPDCDFLQTAEEAAQLVATLNHPHIRTMLDAKSMSAEARPIAETIRLFGSGIAHFHANDANRRAPGYGETDFIPIAQALREVNYDGWVSIEPFDYSPDPQTLARESLKYLRDCFGE
jgi:D-psicose/D-tagatose/L-ribulose 3-epimerase